MNLSDYQQLVSKLEKPLFLAPLFLIVIVVIYNRNTGQELVGLQYVWLPWFLLGLLLLIAYHPFSLGDQGSGLIWQWLASWLYPIGFGSYFYAWQYLPSRDISYVLYIAGWVGAFLLSQYRSKYMDAWAVNQHTQYSLRFRQQTVFSEGSEDDSTPPGQLGI